LEAAAPRIEQAKSVPPEALEALHNASMFRMIVIENELEHITNPKVYGLAKERIQKISNGERDFRF
jgi:hypothetical protein